MDTLKGGGGGHYTIYKAGKDTNKGEGDKHYKKGGDGQYTGRKHMKNVSIPLFIYLFFPGKGASASVSSYECECIQYPL